LVFKRRDRRPIWRIALEVLWPRGGWTRAARYVRLRLNRLPDPPQRIARGIFVGVFTTFTPFYGLHFVTAALLARMIGGNMIAAVLSTFFGNPLTYVPIGVISMKTGYTLLGMEADQHHGGLGNKFVKAGEDLWNNFIALFGPDKADWAGLRVFYDEVFFPYLIGGILPGLVAATIAYYVSLPLITAFQNRRKGLIKAKLAELKKKKKIGGQTD
jgi:uncharacterized protein (DUF2062 family)